MALHGPPGPVGRHLRTHGRRGVEGSPGATVVCVRRLLLSRRWILRTAVAVAWAGTCLWLGWWQWGRSQVTSSPQNLGYALQWPFFALFAVFAWWRMLRLELTSAPARPGHEEDAPGPPVPVVSADTPVPGEAAAGEPDDELAAYNRYLRALYVQDQQRGR